MVNSATAPTVTPPCGASVDPTLSGMDLPAEAASPAILLSTDCVQSETTDDG